MGFRLRRSCSNQPPHHLGSWEYVWASWSGRSTGRCRSCRTVGGRFDQYYGERWRPAHSGRRIHRRPYRFVEHGVGYPRCITLEARVRTWSTNRGIARGRPDLGAGDRIYTLPPNGKHPGPIEFWSSADPGGLSNFSDRRRVGRPYWSIRRSEGRFLCARWPSRNGDGSTLRRAVTFPRRTEVFGR